MSKQKVGRCMRIIQGTCKEVFYAECRSHNLKKLSPQQDATSYTTSFTEVHSKKEVVITRMLYWLDIKIQIT